MTYPTLSTRVRVIYEQYGDRARCVPLTRPLVNSKAGKFKTEAMLLLQTFVYKACGAGLPDGNVHDLFIVFLAWQPKGSSDNDEYETLRGYFRTPHAFLQALSDYVDEAFQEEGWMRCPLTELDQTVQAYFRQSFDVVTEALRTASHVRYWCRSEEGDRPSECRETPFQTEALVLSEEAVMREHEGDTFVLGLHVFSDSCAISGSRGTSIATLKYSVRDCVLTLVCVALFAGVGF